MATSHIQQHTDEASDKKKQFNDYDDDDGTQRQSIWMAQKDAEKKIINFFCCEAKLEKTKNEKRS